MEKTSFFSRLACPLATMNLDNEHCFYHLLDDIDDDSSDDVSPPCSHGSPDYYPTSPSAASCHYGPESSVYSPCSPPPDPADVAVSPLTRLRLTRDSSLDGDASPCVKMERADAIHFEGEEFSRIVHDPEWSPVMDDDVTPIDYGSETDTDEVETSDDEEENSMDFLTVEHKVIFDVACRQMTRANDLGRQVVAENRSILGSNRGIHSRPDTVYYGSLAVAGFAFQTSVISIQGYLEIKRMVTRDIVDAYSEISERIPLNTSDFPGSGQPDLARNWLALMEKECRDAWLLRPSIHMLKAFPAIAQMGEREPSPYSIALLCTSRSIFSVWIKERFQVAKGLIHRHGLDILTEEDLRIY